MKDFNTLANMEENMRIETFEKEIDVETYIEEYVNVEEFLKYCKQCENYNQLWSCPEYNFHPVEYWSQYDTFYVLGNKIFLTDDEKTDWEHWLSVAKSSMSDVLYEKETHYPGSVSISAGSCQICGENNCTKTIGEPCRFPDKMRYSIESLGGNVGLTVSKLLGIKLLWLDGDKVPDYFVLVGGLLYSGGISQTPSSTNLGL
ncbi:MAG: DUF2284 domain-containing protein [Anaerovoracaceae bacterium]